MRKRTPLLAAVLAWAVVAAAVLGPVAPAPAVAQSPANASDQETLEELRRLLEEARKLQEQQQKATGGVQPPAPPASAGPDAPEGEAAAAPPPPKRNPVRPGCMYSGSKLIWEKVPGSCEKKP